MTQIKRNKRFTALVLAADRTANDPITLYTGVPCKAIAPVCGTPMIIRVLDVLAASDLVSSTILCGPPESFLPACPELKHRIESGQVTWLPNLNSPARSAESGFKLLDKDTPVLLTTADHALLTPTTLEYFLNQSYAANADATVGLVKHEDMMTAFPGTKRTVTRLRDGGFCGCNLFTFNPRGRELVTFWRQAEDMRKRPWRLILQILGLRMVLAYLLGSLTLKQALKAVSEKSRVNIQAVILPDPQAGIDVDSVKDLQFAEMILTKTAASSHNQNKST
ncbi:MobA-like NTP transferase domain-containing protein [Nitrosomonas cryotolerans]|uniref:MobA-like NTP transferase domain-containing protein n=1 Tax=Nitrosomonas cryotolerans ATCC 49181 TaxID=1131553 RepID=A0A1N6HAL4_9PROT|nr:nucleotidyltransferase family protein [Nitrosomonas cryotolerans]SFQ15023.1 MobA-like NTP transferase domain-containing protein [Nitrosomonas cryotolerans]SIO16737.1 MobA-like NTP transferase domain-containing protein [Nitrosomonas cryotolerans ATCC 49181]